MSAPHRRPSLTQRRWGKLRSLEAAKQAVSPDQQPCSQRTLDRVTKERDELKQSLEAALENSASLKTSIRNIAKKAMDTANPTPFVSPTDKNPSEMTEEELMTLIGTLVPRDKNVTLEERIEEMETRITQLGGQLGRLLRLKMQVEDNLKELSLSQDYDLPGLQEQLEQLWLRSRSTKLFPGESVRLNGIDSSQDEQSSSATTPRQNETPASTRDNLKQVHIPPPSQPKKGADTHIKDLQPELKQLIIQDLSLFKSNGADWRLMATRVGVPDALIDTWQQMKLPQPMRNVLGVWASSPGATVRMLHRHLVSPQMRCIVLAKRISDYYQVD